MASPSPSPSPAATEARADERSASELDAWRGFTADELAVAVRVLEMCARGPDGAAADGDDARARDSADASTHDDARVATTPTGVLEHPKHKSLRKALLPLIERMHGKMFHGMSRKEYVAAKMPKRERNRRKMAEKAADRARLDQTTLRNERLRRLAALEGANASCGALPLVPDGVACGDARGAIAASEDGREAREDERSESEEFNQEFNHLRSCYVCKRRYRKVHHFYASLCPECAALNWEKRGQSADMQGKFCLVTGARVKIGYRIALKLLRAGASVIATTRFPIDALKRFEEEADASEWIGRLQILAMDLRDLPGLEKLCAHLNATLPRLDVLVNNACQTIRRPPAYYKHLLEGEARSGFTRTLAGANDRCEFLPSADVESSPQALSDWRQGDKFKEAGWMAPSAAMSQLQLLESDKDESKKHFPEGALDVNGQQVDLRAQNSWTMRLGEIETPELLEVLAVNAAAPFVLNGKLRPLLARTVAMDKAAGVKHAAAFVINVSAMEGKFYRHKTVFHPHSNMAKSALNMMTATSARDYASDGIYMNSVDTGWINDENPLEKAARLATEQSFQTPIDEEDAAARVIAPVFEGCMDPPATWPLPYGQFFKDYRESEW
jgi:NAD(P)-dependent dehydrogenase (short-subunit alcohol dehydrogenase family)